MPIRQLRESPSYAFAALPNGAILTDVGAQAFEDAKTQLATRGRSESRAGHYHNGQFRPMIGVYARVPSAGNHGGFFLGVSQMQVDFVVPPGYRSMLLMYQTRLQSLQAHQNALIGSSIKIDLMQFGAGVMLTQTTWRDNLAQPLHVRDIVQQFDLGSIYRLSGRSETRLALRVTYDTCEGVRDYDGQNITGQLTNPAWWDGLSFLTIGVFS